MKKPTVIILGGGFGGLNAAKRLRHADVDIILIDKTNHHLFQPLLYQVATAALSPGDIATPIREVLADQKNVKVLLGEAVSINKENNTVCLENEEIKFDYLIVAVGSRHSYFGKDEWEEYAPGLKTIPDALRIREKLLISFENAERMLFENYNSNSEKYNFKEDIEPLTTFVIVGGGPTGIELAGAIAEISRKTILKDFRLIDPSKARIILIEAMDSILPMFSKNLSGSALKYIESLGVKVKLNTKVTEVNSDGVVLNDGKIKTPNIIWAAGNKAMPLLASLNTEMDRAGRVIVKEDLSVPGHPNIFVIGDAANSKDQHNNVLPGLAPVAIQQAQYVAGLIKRGGSPDKRERFKYFDKGSMATIGRAKAIAEFRGIKLKGFLAWLAWSFIHILYLIGFRNRYRVMIEWIWLYFTRRNGIRLITNNRMD